jgi:tetratricopeptide (TPR) repeat protein
MMKSLLFISLGLALVLSTPLTFAQTPKKEVSSTNKDKAKSFAKKAVAAFNDENYEKALQAFREAYTLNPDFQYLPPIAQCSFLLGRYEETIIVASQYLKEAEPDNPKRPEVEKLLTDSKAALIKQSPEKALIYGPQNADSDKNPNKATTPEKNTTDKVESKPSGNKLFIVAGISGGVGVGAGVVAALANKQLNELTNISSAEEPNVAEIVRFQQRRKILAPLSDVMFGVGLVTSSVGLVIKLKSKKTENPTSAGLSINPTGATLSLQY